MQKLYLSINLVEFMRCTPKNMFLFFVAVLMSGAVVAAHKLPNLTSFKQHYKHKGFSAPSENNLEIYPVLLVEFEDVKFSVPDPKESFTALLNKEGYSVNGAFGSVADYLCDNFNHTRKFRFDVYGVISLPAPIAQYGAHNAMFNDADIPKLVEQTTLKASLDGLDFSIYDNTNDGKVDNLAIIFAGYSESEGGGEDSIWPHQQNIEANQIIVNGVTISSYTCSAELKGNEGATISTPGVFCHEFSHALGLPDLYDTNGEEEGLAPALYGSLSIMDKGNWLDGGNTPPYYSAPEREILGILDIEDLLPDKSYTLEPVHKGGKVYRVKSSNEGEYFLLECRIPQGWDAHIGGGGLVVYHIDKSNKVYGGLPSGLRWEYNNVNCYADHECVRIISAGGAGAPMANVFFPGTLGVMELVSDKGEMPMVDWAGHPVGIGIKDIRYENGKVTFRTVGDYAYDPSLPPIKECKAVPFQNQIRVDWFPVSPKQARSSNVSWIVKWKMRGEGNVAGFVVTDSLRYYIPNIIPGNVYHISVSAVKGNLFGESSGLDVKSIPVNSAFPYIFVLEDGYSVGDIMDLRVLNLVEQYHSVEWYANGVPVNGTSLLLEEDGQLQIMAIIKYMDGSDERIYKNISVSR